MYTGSGPQPYPQPRAFTTEEITACGGSVHGRIRFAVASRSSRWAGRAAGTPRSCCGPSASTRADLLLLGWPDTGGYAEYTLATTVAPDPTDFDWTVTAALPVAGETALRVLNDLAVTAGDTLLIHGAGGRCRHHPGRAARRRPRRTVLGAAGKANKTICMSWARRPCCMATG